MLGAAEPVSAVPWFWLDQYDLTLQIAGLSEGAEQTVRRDLGDGAFILFHLAGDGRLLAASGIGPGNAVARDIRLAEMLIARRARPRPEELASAGREAQEFAGGLRGLGQAGASGAPLAILRGAPRVATDCAFLRACDR